MKKKLCLVPGLLLVLSLPAGAAWEPGAFSAVDSYPGFADVAESDWCADTVKLCRETGLMAGTSFSAFPLPQRTTRPRCRMRPSPFSSKGESSNFPPPSPTGWGWRPWTPMGLENLLKQ